MDTTPPPTALPHLRRSLGRLLTRSRGGGLGGLGLLLVLVLLLPLAACAGTEDGADAGSSSMPASGDEDSAASGSAGSGGDAADVAEPEAEPADGSADGSGGGAGRTSPMERAVVSTGEVALRSDEVARDRARVLQLARTWGGLVTEEQTGGAADDDAFASLVVRVPSSRFDEAMEAVADIGTLVEQSRSSEDVTTQVVDVAARVRAQERSVRRIEALLSEATSLRDVISIEGDLADRQAELDSLKSQRAYLDDQTSLSTISVTISGAEHAPAPREDEGGFVGGLRTGWHALGASAAVVLTVAGAVLPFALVAGLVAVPVLAVRRRRSRPVAGSVAGGPTA